MAVLVFPVDPSSCVIDMLPRRAGQPGTPDRCLLVMPAILLLDQQIGDLALTDQHSQVGQKFGNLRFGHLPGIIQGQHQRSYPWSKLPLIARWQLRQIHGSLGRRVVLLLQKTHIVALNAHVLHHHRFISLEFRIRR